MKDNSKVLLALLTGLAAGAAMGILFAPEKGSETRDKLSDSLKNLGDSIKDRAANEIESLTDFKEKVVESIKSKLKTAEEEYVNTKALANDIADGATSKLNKAKNA